MGNVSGEVVHGYRIVRTLGRGGLGVTYQATRESTGEQVALKGLAVADVDAWKRIEMFEREAQVLSQLFHPSIPRYVDHFTVESPGGATLYIAEELVVGLSLAEVLRAGGRPMDEAEVRRIADELLTVLDYLGRQVPPVIHRDIKPENVLRREDGTIVLVDFGAARATVAPPQGGSTTVGTYGYMAPEQLHGMATPATDIYGLGCTLLFLLTGRSPAELPRRKLRIDFRAHARVTGPFAEWLQKAVEPAPEDRFLSATSARSSLRKLPVDSGAPMAFGPFAPPKTRPLTWALLGTLALTIVGAGTFFRTLARSSAPSAGMRSTGPLGAAFPSDLPARWSTNRYVAPLTLVRAIGAHMSATFSVAVSPSGDRIASSSNDGTVKIWDRETGNPVRALPGHTGRVGGVAWSPDGALVASAGPSAVLVHDATTGATRLTLDGGGKAATSVDFSRDGARLAAGYVDGTVRVWAADTGALVHTLAAGARVLSLRFSPDGRWLAFGAGNQIRLCGVGKDDAPLVLPGHDGPVGGVAWAPDGRILASVGDDHALRIWLATKPAELMETSEASNELWAVAFDPRGKYVATVGKEGIVRVYDAMSLRPVRSRLVEKTGALSLAWADDGNTLVVGDGGGRVEILEVERDSHVDRVPPIPKEDPSVSKSSTPVEATYARAMDRMFSAGGRKEPLDDAERTLREGLKQYPDEPFFCLGLGRIALRRGYLHGDEHTKESLAAADEWVSRALARSPQFGEGHLERAWLDYYEHDDVHAKDEALLAEKLGSIGAPVMLANLAYRANDLDEAERLALRAIALHKRSELSGSYGVLENVYYARGDEKAEERVRERQLELDPDSAWSKGNYAAFLLRHDEYDRAIEEAQAALQIMEYGAARRTLAEAYSEKGARALWESRDPGIAKTAFDNAVTADATCAHGHYGLGAYFRQLAVRRHDASLLARSNDEFDRASALDKDFALAFTARRENERVAVK